MRQDDRAPFDRALHRARASAYAAGEFVGQESFMTAGEILALAVQSGIGPGVGVLDLCCGVGGPGRLLTRELGCAYLGVDASASAVALARERAGDLPCRFALAHVPPLPPGAVDVALLFEAMLAIEDKDALVREVAAALRPGGRFAFTLEAGPPLTTAERALMPDADTVWLTPLDVLAMSMERAGLVVRWQEDLSRAHRATAQALAGAFAADADAIAAQIGRRALDDLLAAHRLWIQWLDEGRVRKLALVAERAPLSGRSHRATIPRVGADTDTTWGLGEGDEIAEGRTVPKGADQPTATPIPTSLSGFGSMRRPTAETPIVTAASRMGGSFDAGREDEDHAYGHEKADYLVAASFALLIVHWAARPQAVWNHRGRPAGRPRRCCRCRWAAPTGAPSSRSGRAASRCGAPRSCRG